MSDYLKERFAFLMIAVGEWLFHEHHHQCHPFTNVWIRVRFGGIEIKHKIGDDTSMMFTLPDDQPDVPFETAAVTGATDKEGVDISADVTTSEVRTDNEAAVSIVDAVGDDGNPTGGKAVHIGSPGLAHLQYDVLYKGVVAKTFEATLNITTGDIDPASIVGGGFNFSGITPDPEV